MKIKGLLLITGLLFVLTTGGTAQSQFGRISGKVIDGATNNGLPFVTVYLYLGEQQKLSARSNSGGNFSFINVAPDVYTIRTSKTGYTEYAKQVRVNPNFTTKLYIPLSTSGSGAPKQPVAVADNVVSKPEVPPTEVVPVSTAATPVQNPAVQTPAVSLPESKPEPPKDLIATTSPEPVTVQKPVEEPAKPVATPVSTPAVAETSSSDDMEAITDETIVYEATEVMPSIEGGPGSVYKNLKYPEIAQMLKVEGTVVCRIYIGTDGTPISVELLKGVHPALDKAAQDALFNVRYTPGMQNGKPVQTMLTMPVKFKLSK